MPEKQEPNRCQMHTVGKITQKKTQLLRCGAPHNTFFYFFFFPLLKTICFSPSVCTAATKLQVLPLSLTSILVPLQELLKQHAGYLLLHVLPAAILFQVTDLPDAEPQGIEITLQLLLPSQHRAIPGTVCFAYLIWPHNSKVCITGVLFRSFTSLFWR